MQDAYYNFISVASQTLISVNLTGFKEPVQHFEIQIYKYVAMWEDSLSCCDWSAYVIHTMRNACSNFSSGESKSDCRNFFITRPEKHIPPWLPTCVLDTIIKSKWPQPPEKELLHFMEDLCLNLTAHLDTQRRQLSCIWISKYNSSLQQQQRWQKYRVNTQLTCIMGRILSAAYFKGMHTAAASYSAFANSCPLQTDTCLLPLIHSHYVLLSSNKF